MPLRLYNNRADISLDAGPVKFYCCLLRSDELAVADAVRSDIAVALALELLIVGI